MKLKYKKLILWTLTILQICVIFSFSLQNDVKSSSLSEPLTEKIKGHEEIKQELNEKKDETGEKLYKSKSAVEMVAKSRFEKVEYLIRKCAHLFIFFVLEILIFMLISCYGVNKFITVLSGFLFSIAVAFVDETIQLFVPGRAGQFIDVLVDTSGAVLGAILFIFGGFLYEKFKTRRLKVDSK